jgi:hypothetical protein
MLLSFGVLRSNYYWALFGIRFGNLVVGKKAYVDGAILKEEDLFWKENMKYMSDFWVRNVRPNDIRPIFF